VGPPAPTFLGGLVGVPTCLVTFPWCEFAAAGRYITLPYHNSIRSIAARTVPEAARYWCGRSAFQPRDLAHLVPLDAR